MIATAPERGEYAPHFEQAGYKVIHNPCPSRWNLPARLRYWIKFARFLKKEGYDVVHNHCNGLIWGSSLAALVTGKRSVFTFHSVFPSRPYSYLYHVWQRWGAKKLFGCRFQSISDSVYNHELSYFHNSTTKIYNWYGEERFYPAMEKEKEEVRRDLDIPREALVVISIGGCSTNKRHTDVIRAVQLIAKEYPSILYLHLGKGETEEEEKDLAQMLGVEKNVRFCGNQREVRKYLVASDIYLMTSMFEGISITTIEAMACGIPAILYNVAGLRDFNRTGENSLLIPEDFNELARKVIHLHTHPAESKALSERAVNLVNNQYSLKTNASKIFNLYERKS